MGRGRGVMEDGLGWGGGRRKAGYLIMTQGCESHWGKKFESKIRPKSECQGKYWGGGKKSCWPIAKLCNNHIYQKEKVTYMLAHIIFILEAQCTKSCKGPSPCSQGGLPWPLQSQLH